MSCGVGFFARDDHSSRGRSLLANPRRCVMNVEVHMSDKSGLFGQAEKAWLVQDAKSLLSRYERYIDNAHLSLHIKAPPSKNRVHVRATLITDKGRYHSSSESFKAEDAFNDCLFGIHAQVAKDIERLQQRWQANT